MLPRLVGERRPGQQLDAARVELGRRERGPGPRIDGVEQRHAQVVGDRQLANGRGSWKLRAMPRRVRWCAEQAVDRLAVERAPCRSRSAACRRCS